MKHDKTKIRKYFEILKVLFAPAIRELMKWLKTDQQILGILMKGICY